MTRKKVKLAYITNDSARKATFKKRKKGLLKKVGELSTLCGIEACAIIYSPYDTQPEVWPSPGGVQRVISRFTRLPEMEQSKKMVNQESFLRQRISKASEQLKRQCKDNRERQMSQIMFQCLTGKPVYNMDMMDLNDLGWLIDQYLKEIERKEESLDQEQAPPASKVCPAVAADQKAAPASTEAETAAGAVVAVPSNGMRRGTPEVVKPAEAAAGLGLNTDGMPRQPWFMALMNRPEPQTIGIGDDLMLAPFGDTSHSSLWPNGFYP